MGEDEVGGTGEITAYSYSLTESPCFMINIRMHILKQRLTEYVRYNSWLTTRLFSFTLYIAWRIARIFNYHKLALRLAGTVHRTHYLPWACREISIWLGTAAANSNTLLQAISQSVNTEPIPANALKYDADPSLLIGSRILVLKKATVTEKGVIVLDYSHLFPIALRRIDLDAIAKRYHLVLEPSWIGFCTNEILGFLGKPYPVFVQSFELVDGEFLSELHSNLHPIPIAANWWVDHRKFFPIHNLAKDADIIMVGAWANYKRHYRLFSALANLKRHGHHLRTICVGYPAGMNLAEMKTMANYYGVADQIEFYEWQSSEDVNRLLNRARVNMIWSLKEGSNRALVEGMCAGVPGLLLKGHNYGHAYKHINDCTGVFATECELAGTLLNICRGDIRWDPRKWILQNMSCQLATNILNNHLRNYAAEHNEHWTIDCVQKVSGLHSMEYWDPEIREFFTDDYSWIKSQIISSSLDA